MTTAEDTLYSDSYDEMSDYLDVLYEKNAADGLSMAMGLIDTEPAESGQQPPGIWCLFGLEVLLSAAGFPSESFNCWMIAGWARGIELQPSEELVVSMKASLAKVIAWRAENSEPGSDLMGLEHEAGENMMRRIESMLIGDGSYHERDEWTEQPPAPAVVQQAPKVPEGPAIDLASPPWWPDLLERCRVTVISDPEVISYTQKAKEKGWSVWRTDFPFWSVESVVAPMDTSAVDWLVHEVKLHDACGTTLLRWVLTPSAYTWSRMEAVLFCSVVEAYRTMLEALTIIGPKGLADFLPHGADPWAELINLQGSSIFGDVAKRYADHLFSKWSGVGQEVPGTHPVEFWQEVRGIWDSDEVITSRFLLDHNFFVKAHWGAWLCGEWSMKSFLKQLGDGVYDTNGLPEIWKTLVCADERFPQFVADYIATARRLLIQLIQEGKFKEAANTFRSYKGPIDMELLLIIVERVVQGEPLDTFRSLTRVNVLPTPEELPAVREKLAAIPQELLKRLVPKVGFARPLILDAISDRKFAETVKVILGTFSEPLMPDAHDFHRYGPHESTRQYHPGRAPCGTTNFNPFFAAAASCPQKTFDEICGILDCDILVDVVYCQRPLKQIAGLPLGKFKGNPDNIIPAEETAIFHRLPPEPEARKEEIRVRADGLARRFLPMMSDRECFYLFRTNHLRDLAYLHAEAAGFGSWKAAMFDLASHLRETSDFILGEYRFVQTPAVLPGYVVFKGKRSLKKVPPAVAKSPEFAPFLGRSQLLHGFSCVLRLTVIAEWVETGELPDAGFCDEFESIFGVDPGDWVRERDQPDISSTLRPAILEFARREKAGRALVFSDIPIIPREFLPPLRECGWRYDKDRGGDYWIDRGFKEVGTFRFRLVTSFGDRAETEGGLPKTPLFLALESSPSCEESDVPKEERFNRAISVIMHDIAITRRNLGD